MGRRVIGILIISLLFASPSWARMGVAMMGGGVAAAAPSGVSDDFSTDTSANYTAINGGISISGGSAHGVATWGENQVYHETSLESADQIVTAVVTTLNTQDKVGVIGRSNGTVGYRAVIYNTNVVLQTLSGGYIADYAATYGAGTYTIVLSLDGSTISVSVNGVERINVTDTTYTTGNYCGVSIGRGNANSDQTVDSLTAVAQ